MKLTKDSNITSHESGTLILVRCINITSSICILISPFYTDK